VSATYQVLLNEEYMSKEHGQMHCMLMRQDEDTQAVGTHGFQSASRMKCGQGGKSSQFCNENSCLPAQEEAGKALVGPKSPLQRSLCLLSVSQKLETFRYCDDPELIFGLGQL